MNYTIHSLELSEPLLCSFYEDTGNGKLILCRTTVIAENFTPTPQEYLKMIDMQEDHKNPEIPAGTYFFVQGFLPGTDDPFLSNGDPVPEVTKAAEALWLEFIWQERKPKDSAIYLRILNEKGEKKDGAVFQLFRLLA